MGDDLNTSHLVGTIWRRQSGGVRDARSHCSSSWRHYQHVSLLTSCVKILVALVINSIFPTTSWALKTIRHDGQPFYRYLALSSLALDSMTQPFPFCCGNLLSLINFSYFGLRWGMSMTEVLWHRKKRTSWHKTHIVDSLDCLRFWVAAANLEVSTAISDWEGGKLSELSGGQLWRIVIGRLSDLRHFHAQDRSALYRSNLINFWTIKTVREVAT